MLALQPFLPSNVQVQAEFTLRHGEIRLVYLMHDPNGEVLDAPSAGTWTEFPRADELWKTTCFEAFWGVPGDAGYWELNLSPAKKSWALYRFDAYRKPQPPRSAFDFELTAVTATRDRLDATLKCKNPVSQLEVSLTAVIRTGGGTQYFALKQASPKADFHARETFALIRGPRAEAK